jgi:prepilin-type processing-associated H-X9-DG protein
VVAARNFKNQLWEKAMRLVGSTLVLVSLFFCSAVRAQENSEAAQNIFAALAARDVPAQLQGKNLTAAWRVLRADEAPDHVVLMQMLGMPRAKNVSPWSAFYYTRGDVLAVGGQIYLIAYRVQPPQTPEERDRKLQYLRAMQDENEAIELSKLPLPLEENTPLVLSLVSLQGSQSLRDIRAFDPAKDLLSAREKIKRETKVMRFISQRNLKQVALGLMQYTQDWDEKFPPMRAAKNAEQIMAQINRPPTAASPVQVMLYPYVRNTQIFLHPKTGRPYLPNYKVSRFYLGAIENPAATFAFFEDAPDAEGKRNVAFADGHVKAFAEAEFQRMRKAQGISESGLPSVAKDKAAIQRQLKAQEKLYLQQSIPFDGGPPSSVVVIPGAPPPPPPQAVNAATP